MIADFKKKQKHDPAKQLLLLLGALVLLVAFFFLVIDSVRLYQKRIELALQVQNLQNKINDIKRKNDDLRRGATRGEDDAYIEKVAREELDLQQPGEKVFSFIVPEVKKPEVREVKPTMLQRIPGWWQWVKDKFKGF
jgi:cell division protein DivIC